MIELIDFQEVASNQISDRVVDYIAAPVRVGRGDKQRRIPFLQLLNSITASGKTLILADAVSTIAKRLALKPVVLWLSKASVVVAQSYANLDAGGVHNPGPNRLPLGTLCEHPCGECGAAMVLRDSRLGLFYGCASFPACRSTHGAHKRTGQPLGIPADRATKAERIAAHALFDRLWKGEGATMGRREAYAWMATAMGLTVDEAHIGRFGAEACHLLRQRVHESFPGLVPFCACGNLPDACDRSRAGCPANREAQLVGELGGGPPA